MVSEPQQALILAVRLPLCRLAGTSATAWGQSLFFSSCVFSLLKFKQIGHKLVHEKVWPTVWQENNASLLRHKLTSTQIEWNQVHGVSVVLGQHSLWSFVILFCICCCVAWEFGICPEDLKVLTSAIFFLLVASDLITTARAGKMVASFTLIVDS